MTMFTAFPVRFEIGASRDFGAKGVADALNKWQEKHPEAEYISHTVTVTIQKNHGYHPAELLITIAYREKDQPKS